MEKQFTVNAAKAASAPRPSTQNEPFPEYYPGGIHRDDLLDERTRGIFGRYAVKLVKSGLYHW